MIVRQVRFGCLAAALAIALTVPAHGQGLELGVDELAVEAVIERTGDDGIGFGFDALWVPTAGVLLRVDAADNRVTEIPLPGQPGRYRRASVGEGAVWIADVINDAILKIDPVSNQIVLSIPVVMEARDGSIGVGEGSVWVTTQGGGKAWLARYSAATGAEEARIALPPSGAGVLVDFGSVWVTGTYKNVVYRIDAATNTLAATIKVAGSPRYLTSGFGSIWVVNETGGVVQRIDPATGAVIAGIETGVDGRFGDIDSGDGSIWVSFQSAPVVQIDPASNAIVRMYRGHGLGLTIRYGGDSIWVTGLAINRIALPR